MSKPIPWVKFEELPGNGGRFIVSPLDRGMGITLGNAMRRVLLSSLPGHAITSLKIDGVQHEFSNVPNVVEDVLDIICNIKSVIFRSSSSEPKVLTLEASKQGLVTAKDIKTDSEVEVINPEQHIAELSSNAKLSIEMVLDSGVGYCPADLTDLKDTSIDTIKIDASFSPIQRVNHKVDSIRVGKELDHDKLVLDVFTDGSVDVEHAVKFAASILVDKFGLFQNLNEQPEEELAADADDSAESIRETALNLTVDDLELSARSSNCLKRAGIETVAELIEKDISELIQIKNFGKKSADEINDKLKQYSLSLKGTDVQVEG